MYMIVDHRAAEVMEKTKKRKTGEESVIERVTLALGETRLWREILQSQP